MSRRGHQPVRTCLGCRGRDERSRLVRLVCASSGALRLDARGCAPGRGGYLHRNESCWIHFARGKGAVRSLRVTVPSQARQSLLDELRAGVEI